MEDVIMNFGGNSVANRPVFILKNSSPFYERIDVDFKYYSGFAEVQKRKSIKSLHEAFLNKKQGGKILEISSKSENELGIKLSAFNLKIETKSKKMYSVEVVFQSSKVFEHGGPYLDLLDKTSKEAKKDIRLKESGELKYFNYFGNKFELNPKTYFYNWLYVNTVNLNKNLGDALMRYNCFTDIEFNPNKSINCQAMAAAVYVSLRKNGLLDLALQSKEKFLEVVYKENEDKTRMQKVQQINMLDNL